MKPIPRTLLLIAALLLFPVLLLLIPRLAHWPAAANRHDLRVSVLDVGEGDSILVQTPSGHTLLIDGGGTRRPNAGAGTGRGQSGDQSEEDPIGERVLMPQLRRLGVGAIDVLLITHPHGDHIGGLPAVLRDLPVGCVLDGTTLPYPSAGYRRLVAQIRRQTVPYRAARRGETLDFGDGVHAVLLNPPCGSLTYGSGYDDKTINDYSAVVRLGYGHTVLLLDGDAEQEAEDDMLASYPAVYLKADALKAGHHGSRNASSDEWLSAVAPRAAVISCGRGNLFHHPHAETLARLAAHNVRTYRTDQNGTVTLTSDGNSVTASSER